jgi:hypothetical protein
MKILNNPKRKQYFVQQKNESINTYITVPFAGARSGTKLTIKTGSSRIDLNGRQVKTLRSVLEKGLELSETKRSN